MRAEEARKIAFVLATADGGCPNCAGDLADEMQRAFPEFNWRSLVNGFGDFWEEPSADTMSTELNPEDRGSAAPEKAHDSLRRSSDRRPSSGSKSLGSHSTSGVGDQGGVTGNRVGGESRACPPTPELSKDGE